MKKLIMLIIVAVLIFCGCTNGNPSEIEAKAGITTLAPPITTTPQTTTPKITTTPPVTTTPEPQVTETPDEPLETPEVSDYIEPIDWDKIALEIEKEQREQLEKIGLFGYRIDEEGNIMVNSSDWIPATPEQFEKYFFGQWESIYYRAGFYDTPYTIDEIPDDSLFFMAGDKAIIWVTPDDIFDFWWFKWIDLLIPDEMIYFHAREFLENEVRFHNMETHELGIAGWQYWRIT